MPRVSPFEKKEQQNFLHTSFLNWGFNVAYLHKGEQSCFSVKRSSEWVEWGKVAKNRAMTDKH